MASETRSSTNQFASFPPGWSVSWFDMDEVETSNDVYATAQTDANGALTHNIIMDGFGFSIPGGATIDGVEINIERRASSNDGTNEVLDQLVNFSEPNAPVMVSDNLASATPWSTAFPEATTTYGSSASLSGATGVTPAKINSSQFRVALGVKINTDTVTVVSAIVDHVEVKVTYTIAGGGGSTAGAFLVGMIAPRRRISFPGLWLPRPRPLFQFRQQHAPQLLIP